MTTSSTRFNFSLCENRCDGINIVVFILSVIEFLSMNPFLHVLSVKELNEIFLKESKKFMMALKYNVSADELQKIRDNIVEIARILQSRETTGSKSEPTAPHSSRPKH